MKDYLNQIFELIAVTDSILDKTNRYLNNEIMGQVLNTFGILNNFIIYIIFPFIAIYFLKRNYRISYRFEFLVILNCFVAIGVIQFAIFYRYFNYFLLFDIILFAEFGGKLARYLSSQFSLAIVSATFLGIIFLQMYSYFSPITQRSDLRLYSRYYPYSSVLTKKVDWDRERLFKYYNAY